MIERLIQRLIATKRIYGWIPALLSVPRAFYGNLLNLHAVIRAYRIYYFAPSNQTTGKQPVWDKTEHHFPGSHILTPYRQKIGDLLLAKKRLTKKQLAKAILEQQKTGERLGSVLCRLNLISNEELLELLSNQYNLKLLSESELAQIKEDNSLLPLPKRIVHWLEKNETLFISIDETKNLITIGIKDPTNEMLLEKIINHIHPYQAHFVLIH